MKFSTLLVDFYNKKIVAGWWRSWALIGGWVTALSMFMPNILDFASDHVGFLSRGLLPTFEPETQAFVLGIYVTFIAPPLRAWAQEKMQEAAKMQELAKLMAEMGEDGI